MAENAPRRSSKNLTPTSQRWWKIHFFRGMVKDVKRRAPLYWSDWQDAWDYRVVPATLYMFFAKYGPRVGAVDDTFRLIVQCAN